jgi:hypothetical protein
MIKITIIAILLTVVLSNSYLNVKHRKFLNGEGEFDISYTKEIYSEFKTKHHEKN